MTTIFVFGSNEQGVHGAGAAKEAYHSYGAELGVGSGRTGNAYAIPTKRRPTKEQRQIPLEEISSSVSKFIKYAREHPELTFSVTRIGCGFAGYKEWEIAPMFNEAPLNVVLPSSWRSLNKACKEGDYDV